MRWFSALTITIITLAGLSGCSQDQEKPQQQQAKQATGQVNVYSARKEALIKPLLDRFTEQTGTQVNLVTASADALLERMKSEGKHSPADILITTDAGRLHRATEAGVLKQVTSETLRRLVPQHLRNPDGYWYGLSVRARVIVYHPDRVEENTLGTYEGLAEEQWRDRICIRSSNNIYNQSLVASLIAHNGKEATQQWANGLVANFARSPKGGDRDQIKAVAAGECDLAVVNTYYLGKMLTDTDAATRDLAQQVSLFWPNQESRGAHINVSGAGLATHGPNTDNALALLEFLVSDDSQQWYAHANHEYPIRDDIAVSDTLKSWGEFKADKLPLVKLGEFNAEAVKIMDRAEWP